MGWYKQETNAYIQLPLLFIKDRDISISTQHPRRTPNPSTDQSKFGSWTGGHKIVPVKSFLDVNDHAQTLIIIIR